MPLLNGIFASAGSDTSYTSGGNYVGSGIDGVVTISSNTFLTVPNKNGSYDGDMVVKQYESLTIDSGATLTTDQPCRGLFIYVQKDCTINGTLSMTARGAFANPTVNGASDALPVNSQGLRYGFAYTGGTDTLTMDGSQFNGVGSGAKLIVAKQISGSGNNYKVLSVSRLGTGGGSPQVSGNGASPGIPANAGAGYSGGGASGGGYNVNGGGRPGSGGQGTCFSGGAGGGGFNANSDYYISESGGAYGGKGGDGFSSSGLGGTQYQRIGSGGAGNPKGSSQNSGSDWPSANGENGTGGLLFLVVGGNLTIGATGSINSNGSKGGPGGAGDGRGGGSGAGVVNVLYKSLSNSGIVQAIGVPYSTGSGNEGGAGSVQSYQMR
jgi:hypothetical protein